MSIDYLAEIDRLTRQRAVIETKMQLWKLSSPMASDLYNNIKIAIDNSLLHFRTKLRQDEIEKSRELLKDK